MRGTIRARLVRGVALALVLGGAIVFFTLPGGPSLGLLIGFALAAVFALVTTVVLARGIADPIRRLTALAATSGERQVFAVEGPDEVERLAAALRAMSAAIRSERGVAEAERDRLAALVDELDDAIVIADAQDQVVLANAAADRMLGIGALAGHRLIEALRDHEVLDAVTRARAGAQATATVDRAEPRRFVRVLARPLEGGRLLLVLQDLTALRRLETVRSDFIANVSHELRTPLASLKAMAETLEEGALDDPPAARDFVGRMHREIDGLTQLVNELLTLTRIESGEEQLRLATVAPRDLASDAMRRMAALAARAGVELRAEVGAELPPVRADGERIAQVFANLIHNAVKFTPANGTVRVRAALAPGAVAFAVQDSGAGIAADEIDRVFERFYKGDRARAGGGTGLGLAIAKHIVHAHGGTLAVVSDGPGRGATFTFTLPLA